jgi:antitoxin (DNA-binding transcriptional repressor) of toxin-antitoxin stability system
MLAKDGKPWARLVPLGTDRPRRQPGLLRGQRQLPPPQRPVALLRAPSLLLDTAALLW